MNKNIFNSEKELLNFFINLKYFENRSVEDIERVFGIEFAFKDGKFPHDWYKYKEEEFDDNQEIDYSNYRVIHPGGLPDKYPCLVIHEFDDDYDRYGQFYIEIIEYVYLDDFNIKKCKNGNYHLIE